MQNHYLISQGFELAYGGSSFYTKSLPGFGFTVWIRVSENDHESEYPAPLALPSISVSLPHQCDSWEIVEPETSHAAALDLMRSWIKESRQAYDIVAMLDLDQVAQSQQDAYEAVTRKA